MDFEIDGVELLEELGRGAHGAVYRARRGAVECAVKVALEATDGSEFARFQREAVTLARLSHPALPKVLDVARSGRPYLIMELVDGETLAERVRQRGPLDEHEAIAIVMQLADVLAHVHEAGLVHRDVKPRNVVFAATDGKLRLVDFGIAIKSSEAPHVLAEGTLPYAAPEQFSTERRPLDGRADLFSLGCVLLECLTGSPAPGESTAGDLRPGLVYPRALAAIIATLRAQDARERFGSAAQVVRALREIASLEGRLARHDRVSLRTEFARAEPSRAPLEQREIELAVLRKAWAEALTGHARTVVVEGVSGSGKTRLLDAFMREVAEVDVVALRVSGIERDPVPFAVVRRLIEDWLAIAGAERLREVATGFESVVAVLSPGLAAALPDAPPIAQSKYAHHVFVESLAKFVLRLLAATRKTLLSIDDGQWIDSGSLAVLRNVLASRGGPGSLIVFTVRTEAADSLEALVEHAEIETLERVGLGPLGRAATLRLARRYLGNADLSVELCAHLAAFSDGTPLRVLEVVNALVDERAILPNWAGWQLEPSAAAINLPDSVRALLRRRIERVDGELREVLAAAAIMGIDIDVASVAVVAGRSENDVSQQLLEAHQIALLAGSPESPRFIHQSVPDALLARLVPEETRELHQRAALALSERLNDNPSLIFRVADHFWYGDWAKTPERALAVIARAGKQAFDSYDNRRALSLFAQARSIREALETAASASEQQLEGEALLRLGQLTRGRELLLAALQVAGDRELRAAILSRVAWTHEVELDSDKAVSFLRRAFVELDEPFPEGTLSSVGTSALAFATHALGRRSRARTPDRRRHEILANLYYQTVRLGALSANVALTTQGAVRGLSVAEPLGPSPALARAYLTYAFLLTAIGQSGRGRRYLEQGKQLAIELRDPVAFAHALQTYSTTLAWAGDFRKSLEVGATLLLEHGHWLDFAEHCLVAFNQHLIESVRGHCYEELFWIEHVLRQVKLNPDAYGMWEVNVLEAHAALVTLGREAESNSILAPLRAVTVAIPPSSAYFVLTFGPRARALVEAGTVGAELDALDAEFKKGRHDPKRVNLAVTEYYFQLAHGRIHGYLRAEHRDRARVLASLRSAALDLRAAARVPAIKAHSVVVDAFLAHFEGEHDQATRLFAEAEALAIEEESPWVRYAVARGRAHSLKARGRLDAALREARSAEELARETGAVHRLRWIREEFELPHSEVITVTGKDANVPPATRSATVTRAALKRRERHARALLGISRLTYTEPNHDRRRNAILDELVRCFGATQGHVFVEEGHALLWSYGRDAFAQNLAAATDSADAVLEAARWQKVTAISDDTETLHSRIAVPLLNGQHVRGVLYLESTGCGAFIPEDGAVLAGLSGQLLDGGLHRDLDPPTRRLAPKTEVSAFTVAASGDQRLERQRTGGGTRNVPNLPTNDSEHRTGLVNLNEVVSHTIERLRTIVRHDHCLEVALEPDLFPVQADSADLELLLVHSVSSALQRLRGPGDVLVETTSVQLDNASVVEFGTSRQGAHALLVVSALPEGSGSGAEELSNQPVVPASNFDDQAFETALTACSARLNVVAEPGWGTSIQILFPQLSNEASQTPISPTAAGMEVILLVEPSDRAGAQLQRQLELLGYRVLRASNPTAARELVGPNGKVDVLVADLTVGLPGKGDPTYALRRELRCRTALYTSRYTWNALRMAGVARPRAQFVQKPFSAETLARRVRAALQAANQD